MIDDVITLVKETITGIDQYGNEVKTPVEREVFCKVRSVTRNEFYSAAVSNLRPEYIPPPPDQNPDPRRLGSPRPWRAPGALPTSTRGSW